jgi:membrane protein
MNMRERSDTGWWMIVKAAWAEAGKDNLGLIASGVAFYGFLAFVPTVAAIVFSYGLFREPPQVARDMSVVADLLPHEAAPVIGAQLRDMVGTTRSQVGLGLFLLLGLALYGLMKGAGAMVTALNVVFAVEETRPFFRRSAVTLAVAAITVAIFLLAGVSIAAFNLLGIVLPDLEPSFRAALQIGLWLATIFIVRIGIAAIFRIAPDRRSGPKTSLKPGSVLATAGWVAATAAFSFYVRNFGQYNAIYGALGAVVLFLTWLYVSAHVILLGGKLNRVLERAYVQEGAVARSSIRASRLSKSARRTDRGSPGP